MKKPIASQVVANISRAAKKTMMREYGITGKQYRRAKKWAIRKAKEESV